VRADVTRRTEILDAAAEVLARDGMRAPLSDIAGACGILPSSLYHHFDSKEALIVELLQRFQGELEQVAASVTDEWVSARGSRRALIDLGVAVADVARRHPAAMAFAYIEPPAATGDELRRLAREAPEAVDRSMTSVLTFGRSAAAIRPDIDVELLSSQVCRAMLQSAISDPRGSALGPAISRAKCELVLDGGVALSARPASLTWGPAHQAADEVIGSWGSRLDDPADRATHILRVASQEFAKRGIELTRMRDIAAAAGLDPRAVYRVFSSKDALIHSILSAYVTRLDRGWRRVVAGAGTHEERLDALLWLMINAHLRFDSEHRMLALAVQQRSPTTGHAQRVFRRQVRDLAELLTDGDAVGSFRVVNRSTNLRAGSIFSMLFPPANLVQRLTPDECLAVGRDLVIRGIAVA
jgi:AcrR family transcriptional regulator